MGDAAKYGKDKLGDNARSVSDASADCTYVHTCAPAKVWPIVEVSDALRRRPIAIRSGRAHNRARGRLSGAKFAQNVTRDCFSNCNGDPLSSAATEAARAMMKTILYSRFLRIYAGLVITRAQSDTRRNAEIINSRN